MSTEAGLELLGMVLWYLMFATPFITVPLVWRWLPAKKIWKLLIGLVLAGCFSLLLFFLSLGILFRAGMGPA